MGCGASSTATTAAAAPTVVAPGNLSDRRVDSTGRLSAVDVMLGTNKSSFDDGNGGNGGGALSHHASSHQIRINLGSTGASSSGATPGDGEGNNSNNNNNNNSSGNNAVGKSASMSSGLERGLASTSADGSNFGSHNSGASASQLILHVSQQSFGGGGPHSVGGGVGGIAPSPSSVFGGSVGGGGHHGALSHTHSFGSGVTNSVATTPSRQRAVFGIALDRVATRAPFWETDFSPPPLSPISSAFPAPLDVTSGTSSNGGSVLGSGGFSSTPKSSLDVAWPVAVLCRQLEETYSSVEGLFRVHGEKLQVEAGRIAMTEGRNPCLEVSDPHSLAQLLRSFFRELPNPLLPHDLVVSAGKNIREDEEKDLPTVLGVLQLLTPAQLGNTRRLCRLLFLVAKGMEATNNNSSSSNGNNNNNNDKINGNHHRSSSNSSNLYEAAAELSVCWAHSLARAPVGTEAHKIIPESYHVVTFVRRLIELHPRIFREVGAGKQMLRGYSSNDVARDLLMASHSSLVPPPVHISSDGSKASALTQQMLAPLSAHLDM